MTAAPAPAASAETEGSYTLRLRLQRGGEKGARPQLLEYRVEVEPGMVVLDALHRLQAEQAPELAVRWNCKAGKCGSCSCEVNGHPKLTCMTRLDDYDPQEPLTVQPLRTFPLVKDLVTDVSWNYTVNRKITPYRHPEGLAEPRMSQTEVERVQEFRKCIECYLCQNVCHVLRDHHREEAFAGPRFLVRLATVQMHPLDTAGSLRLGQLKNLHGLGLCNITKCCTQVCPESIAITDNAIIPLKERVADEFYDPLKWLWRKLFGRRGAPAAPTMAAAIADDEGEGQTEGEEGAVEAMAGVEAEA